MAKKTYTILGLMSGSSLDGLDLAMCQFSMNDGALLTWELRQAATLPFSEKWLIRLANLPKQSALIYAQTHTYFGYYLGELVNDFLNEIDVIPDYIASHGHTIFHEPNKKFTAQIGDGAALAATTGIATISNFRAQDVALDGEGAPVAPIADKLLFGTYDFLLNLGGIVNLSCNIEGEYIAFDIGGCNQLLNALANELELPFDDKGALASKGTVNSTLLKALNAIPFFQKQYPKSLSNQWVEENLIQPLFNVDATVIDLLRTTTEHIAFQTIKAISNVIENEGLDKKEYQLLVTGGGAFNDFLMDQFKKQTPENLNLRWLKPNTEIIQFKEAILMALMGVLRVEKIENVMKSVTGAKRNTTSGTIALP